MKFSKIVKSVALAAAVASAGSAFAAVKVVDATASAGDKYVITSATGSLSFSTDATTAFSLGGVAVTAAAPATYVAPKVTTPVSSFSYDDSTNFITRLATAGGAVQTAASAGLTGGPGKISVTNVTIDVASKIAYADVTGDNGVVAGNYAFFNLATITGATTITGPGTFSSGATGLTLTTTAVALVKQGLNLNNFGATVLAGITDFGTLSATITVAAAPAVPEPSTYALMGLGLAGAAFVARRRAAK